MIMAFILPQSGSKEMTVNHRLLILSCSQRKRPDLILLPALERYDGPMFRMLRRFLRECPSKDFHPEVYILSAQFGLITAKQPIPNYDWHITPQRASVLQPQILDQLRQILQQKQYKELFISVGKDYATALSGYEQLIPSHIRVTIAIGPRGRKQAGLYDWLYRRPPPPTRSHIQRDIPRIRGIIVALTPEQVFDTARRAMAETSEGLGRYQSWCVMIDGQRVAAKWLVSQITGLPVSAFVSDEARRLLMQLGVKVIRV
jgi:hypothetical protein